MVAAKPITTRRRHGAAFRNLFAQMMSGKHVKGWRLKKPEVNSSKNWKEHLPSGKRSHSWLENPPWMTLKMGDIPAIAMWSFTSIPETHRSQGHLDTGCYRPLGPIFQLSRGSFLPSTSFGIKLTWIFSLQGGQCFVHEVQNQIGNIW